MTKIYCYTKCTTCKKALKWLSKKLPDLSENEMIRLLASDVIMVKSPLLITGD